MKNTKKKGMPHVSRRDFLKFSALGLAGLTILPSWTMNGVRVAPSDRVVLGFIGVGQQGLSDFHSFSSCPGVQVAACSDVDSLKVERFKKRINSWQSAQKMSARCDGYELYEDLLNRKEIDAVSIATPDHWHALGVVHACEAGKDVYVQKPLGYTITEGYGMVRAVRDNNVTLQVGSQQRSDKEFIKAVELVRQGAIGHIEKIHVRIGEPPIPYNLEKQPVPDNLNFNQWLGPINDPNIHYNPGICPPISLDPERNESFWAEWRWYREIGNGYIGDWGAHMFDIAQWAIGMDGSAPIEYIPKGYEGAEYLTMKYANGIVMTEQPFRDDDTEAKGVRFIGTKGWIQVGRGFLVASDPKILNTNSTERKEGAGEYEVSSPHMQNFIDCVRSGKNPVAPVEVGCSTNAVCCLANMAMELNRPVKWNPATLSFVDDAEATAHRLYKYDYRRPYKHALL